MRLECMTGCCPHSQITIFKTIDIDGGIDTDGGIETGGGIDTDGGKDIGRTYLQK